MLCEHRFTPLKILQTSVSKEIITSLSVSVDIDVCFLVYAIKYSFVSLG